MRIFSADQSYGDPYDWSATVRWLDRKTIEITGIHRAPSLSQWRAIRECCRDAGAEEFVFWRIKGGAKKLHRILTE